RLARKGGVPALHDLAAAAAPRGAAHEEERHVGADRGRDGLEVACARRKTPEAREPEDRRPGVARASSEPRTLGDALPQADVRTGARSRRHERAFEELPRRAMDE